jgi:hypothetical protein
VDGIHSITGRRRTIEERETEREEQLHWTAPLAIADGDFTAHSIIIIIVVIVILCREGSMDKHGRNTLHG